MAQSYPDAIAMIDVHGRMPVSITIADFDLAIDRKARALRRIGFQRGEHLAVALCNSIESWSIYFGALRAGLVPVCIDIGYGNEFVKYLLTDSSAVGVIADMQDFAPIADTLLQSALRHKVSASCSYLDWPVLTSFETAEAYLFEPESLGPSDLCAIMYTSGTTGTPKGVRIEARSSLAFLNAGIHFERVDERPNILPPVLNASPLSYGRPELFASAFRHNTVILSRIDLPERSLEALARYQCVAMMATAPVFHKLLAASDTRPDINVSHAIDFFVFGAPLSEWLAQELPRRFPSSRVHSGYASIEGGSPFTWCSPTTPPPRGSVGIPRQMPNIAEVELRDEFGRVSQRYGELYVCGDIVAGGYQNRPEETAEKFKDGWFKTDDIFSVDEEGYFHFVTRADDVFFSDGDSIHPREVEEWLLKHTSIGDACVVAGPDVIKGNIPLAAVSLRPGYSVTVSELHEHCRSVGAAFALPARIEILSSIPSLRGGKHDRRKVLELLLDRSSIQ